MTAIVSCIIQNHDLCLVLLAGLFCILGSWATFNLFQHAALSSGAQRLGWHFLTAVTAGAAIWCTHFIALLGYENGLVARFDPLLTIASLVTAVLGCTAGFALAASGRGVIASLAGGMVIGLSIAGMHYLGMMAYHIAADITWNTTFVVASIVMATFFATSAIGCTVLVRGRYRQPAAIALLCTAILSLHFTGMTAVEITPLGPTGDGDDFAMHAIALAIAAVGMIVLGVSLTIYLIDSRNRSETVLKLRHMALHDGLTGLPNRICYNEELDRRLALAQMTGANLAVIAIDLDRFKEINDLRGHQAGDEVLRFLGHRMSPLINESTILARIGGDEFAAIKAFTHKDELTDFISTVEKSLNRPMKMDGSELAVSASLGIAVFPQDAETPDVLINNASLAMYRAQGSLDSRVCFYDPSMDEQARARRALTEDLRKAITNEELAVHYQVQTSVATGDIRGYEALLRWTHPKLGSISPMEFIPLAEENGLILQLGEWVLRRACELAVTWKAEHKIAVNLSAAQFSHTDLPHMVQQILLETGLAPNRLELELTESTILKDRTRSLHILRQIRALGVSIALDDFGTGYSSLDTLRTFPFDKIKMDRSFMNEVESSPQAKAIIRAVLALGKSLDIPVLAEGIETADQLALLKAEGCDEAQGYLLGRPAPFPVERLIKITNVMPFTAKRA